MSVPEEKQKVGKLDLSKFKNPPAREITTSHSAPLVTENSTIANITAATNTPSPAKMCKRWGSACPFCVQSAPHPSPMDSDWSEEDRDGEIEKANRREKQKKEEEKMKWRQEEEKKILDSNYYPPESIYVSSHQEQPPTVVNDLIPAPENSRDVTQKEGKSKTEEDRRIVLELLHEERDLDYY